MTSRKTANPSTVMKVSSTQGGIVHRRVRHAGAVPRRPVSGSGVVFAVRRFECWGLVVQWRCRSRLDVLELAREIGELCFRAVLELDQPRARTFHSAEQLIELQIDGFG